MDYGGRQVMALTSSSPIVQLFDTFNALRTELALAATEQIAIPNIEVAEFKILYKTQKNHIRTRTLELNGRDLGFSAPSVNDQPPRGAENVIFLGELLEGVEADILLSDFVRLDCEVFSLSYEGEHKVLNYPRGLERLADVFVQHLGAPDVQAYKFSEDFLKG